MVTIKMCFDVFNLNAMDGLHILPFAIKKKCTVPKSSLGMTRQQSLSSRNSLVVLAFAGCDTNKSIFFTLTKK